MSSVVIWRDEATGVTASWNKQGPHTVRSRRDRRTGLAAPDSTHAAAGDASMQRWATCRNGRAEAAGDAYRERPGGKSLLLCSALAKRLSIVSDPAAAELL